jgi:RNA polymerase sigma factor (sigma-70 family)
LKGTLLSFSIGVASYIFLESRKKLAPTPGEMPDTTDENLFAEQLEKLNEAERLKRLVKTLPPVLQDTLYFYYDEELTTREIGKILHLPEGTIKSHLFRARESLREMMQTESRSQ